MTAKNKYSIAQYTDRNVHLGVKFVASIYTAVFHPGCLCMDLNLAFSKYSIVLHWWEPSSNPHMTSSSAKFGYLDHAFWFFSSFDVHDVFQPVLGAIYGM